MRSSSSSLAALSFLALVAGCSQTETDDGKQEIGVAKSSLARDTAPTLSDAERTTFADERAAFSVDLLKKVAEGRAGKNVLVSPHSASIALAMTYAGTGAGTKPEMAKALHFTLADDRLHAAFNATDLALASRQHAAKYEGGGAVQISSANSLWSQNGASSYEPAFLDTLARDYGTGVNILDFNLDGGESARKTINGWVSEKTQEKIPELLGEGSVTGASWVLVNAIYLKANWQTRFEKASTADATFTTAAGSAVTVPMMHGDGNWRGVHRDDYDAVEIPYDGGELAFVAIVPASGTFSSFAQNLTGKTLRELPLADSAVELSMPKFETRTSVEMTKALQELGMPTAGDFPGNADRIEVIQEAMLIAQEDGTEAAAATAVIGRETSAPAEPPQKLKISLDRPFIYAIVDKPTGTILFLGETLDASTK